jgi:hypothetical protein
MIDVQPHETVKDRHTLATPRSIRGRRGHTVFDDIPGLANWIEAEFLKVPTPTYREMRRGCEHPSFGRRSWQPGFRRENRPSTYHRRWKKEQALRETRLMTAAHGVLDVEAGITAIGNRALTEEFLREYSQRGLTPKAMAILDMHRKMQASSSRREAERRAAGTVERRAFERAREEMVRLKRLKQPRENRSPHAPSRPVAVAAAKHTGCRIRRIRPINTPTLIPSMPSADHLFSASSSSL